MGCADFSCASVQETRLCVGSLECRGPQQFAKGLLLLGDITRDLEETSHASHARTVLSSRKHRSNGLMRGGWFKNAHRSPVEPR